MTRRIVIVPLTMPQWRPPGTDVQRWRRALADDLVDLMATLAEVDAALAVVEADREFAAAVAWPTMRVYALPRLSVRDIFLAAAVDGFEQAVVIAPDAPDLPGMMIAKLLRPLTTRPVAVANAVGEARGLIGVASRLPMPDWLPEIDLDSSTIAEVRSAAPSVTDVAGTPGWHRLRTPEGLSRLDPNLDGWDATRALLSPQPR